MYSELQDSRLTLMEVMDEYVERRVLSEEDHNRANSFTGSKSNATLWARIAQNVKKPSLTVNVIDFEFFGFYESIWIPWSPLGPKKS